MGNCISTCRNILSKPNNHPDAHSPQLSTPTTMPSPPVISLSTHRSHTPTNERDVTESTPSARGGERLRGPKVPRELIFPRRRRRLEDDGYIHANLCRHMAGAGRIEELVWLLFRPQWAKRQVEVNDIVKLERDFKIGLEAIENEMGNESDDESYESAGALWVISAGVTLSAGYVGRNEMELYFQLQGRLLFYAKSYERIREYVRWIEMEADGPKLVCCNPILVQAGGPNIKIIPLNAEVYCMVVMKNGEKVACGCGDGSIAIVNLVESKVEKSWNAHKYVVSAIAVSRDGTQIVSGSGDKTAKVWDVESDECFATFNGHTDAVSCVAIMKDERVVISCSWDGMVHIWDMYTGEVEVPPIKADDYSVQCMAVLDDGEHIVTGGHEKTLKIWKWRSGVQVGDAFHGHKHRVSCVAVTPDGEHIVSGSLDYTIRQWNIKSRGEIGDPLQGHTHGIKCVGVSRDGRRIVSGSAERTIQVRDSKTEKEVCEVLEGHTSRVTGVSFLGDNDSIVSCSEDGTVRVWDIRRKKTEIISDRHYSRVSSVQFIGDGECVVSGSWDETLRIWDTKSGRQVGDPIRGHSGDVTDVAVTRNGRHAVSVSWDKKVIVWDLKTRKLLHALAGHTDWINCVSLTPEGDRAVTGSSDGTVRVWDLVSMDGSHIVLEGYSFGVERVFVTDDVLRIVSVNILDRIFVSEIETKRIIKEVQIEGACRLSRREVLNVVGERTGEDNAGVSIVLDDRKIVYTEGHERRVLGTVESDVKSWALSPDKGTICLGLADGQVAFMKVER